MRKILVPALGAAVLSIPLAAQADGFSYSYVEAAYVNTDIDDIDTDVDGFALRGSLEVTSNVFLFASYSDQSAEALGVDVDFTTYELGGGYAWPISPTLDVYGTLSYVSAEADAAAFDADDDGFALAAGLRGRVAEGFELEGAIRYVDLSDSGDDTSFVASGRYFFTDTFAVGAEARFSDDATGFGVGVRLNFGQ